MPFPRHLYYLCGLDTSSYSTPTLLIKLSLVTTIIGQLLIDWLHTFNLSGATTHKVTLQGHLKYLLTEYLTVKTHVSHTTPHTSSLWTVSLPRFTLLDQFGHVNEAMNSRMPRPRHIVIIGTLSTEAPTATSGQHLPRLARDVQLPSFRHGLT